MTEDRPDSRSHLARVIGVPGVAFTAFNCVVGVGIFGLPGLIAAVLGPAAILAYLVCLVLIGLVALCFAESGSRVPEAGGLYAYATAAFGPVVGGVAGALFLFANAIGSTAALARYFMDTLAGIFPALAQPQLNLAVLVLIYVGMAVTNILGTRDGTRLTVVLGILKLIPLVLLILIGAFSVRQVNLVWQGMPPLGKVGDGALILVFAFFGIESGLGVSGETRDPARTIPRAIALALGMVAVLYIGLQSVTQGVLGAALASSKTPLADTAGAMLGPWGAHLLAMLTLVSAGGYLAADMLSSPRIGHALAQAGQLPRIIGFVHPRYATPAVSILLYGTLVVALAASGTFQEIAALSVAGTLILYLICCLGVLRLRAKALAGAGLPFVAPGGPLVPLAAAAMIVWLLTTLAWLELAATAAFVVIAASIYFIQHLKTRTPH
jgi:APA family basic amino acid/polyamine antiporter